MRLGLARSRPQHQFAPVLGARPVFGSGRVQFAEVEQILEGTNRTQFGGKEPSASSKHCSRGRRSMFSGRSTSPTAGDARILAEVLPASFRQVGVVVGAG